MREVGGEFGYQKLKLHCVRFFVFFGWCDLYYSSSSSSLCPVSRLVFASHKRHCVTPVKTGNRKVLVIEIWVSSECVRECVLRHGMPTPNQSDREAKARQGSCPEKITHDCAGAFLQVWKKQKNAVEKTAPILLVPDACHLSLALKTRNGCTLFSLPISLSPCCMFAL